MNNNYLVINGKRVDLTEEQIKQLGIENNKENPFIRYKNKNIYAVNSCGRINELQDDGSAFINQLYISGNYCTDKQLLKEKSKEEILNRLLWRFSIENGGNEINCHTGKKYYIYKDGKSGGWGVDWSADIYSFGVVYFISREIAEEAFNTIVKPFYAGKLEICKNWE